MMSSKLSPSEESAAWGLLFLRSAYLRKLQFSPEKQDTAPVALLEEFNLEEQEKIPIAVLEGRDFHYEVVKEETIIGRRSSQGDVDVSIANSYISRKHLTLTFDRPKFYLDCHSKNGIIVETNVGIKLEKGTQIQLPTT